MIGSVIFTAPCLDADFDGDAILFRDGSKMNIGRIFVAPEHFRKGYGLFIMTQIEEQFPDVTLFALDIDEELLFDFEFMTSVGIVSFRQHKWIFIYR